MTGASTAQDTETDGFDAVIVGGRIAGAATAILLGRLGRRVLVCDRDRLPSPAISTHFFGPSVLAAFEDLGVLDQVLATGAPPLRRWHLQIQDGYFGGPMLPRAKHPYNLCVRREALDAILLDRARAQPTVEVRDRRPVQRLLTRDGRVCGVAGAGWQAHARVVIGADGRGSAVAKHVGAATLFDAGIVRATFHAYWRGVRPLPEPALELWHDGDDIVQTGPCDDGQSVVMLSCPPEAFARLNATGADGYLDRLRAIPGMAARLAGAEQVSPVYRGGALRNFHRAAAGPGWRLVGDALCHKDPLFGAGIADALTGARALAETLDSALSERCDWPQSAERYAALTEEKIAAKMRAELGEIHIQRPDPGQEAWIRGVLNHPGFAFELIRGCSQLFAGLAPERREFWQARADLTARALGLPPAARITEAAAPVAAAGAAG